MTLFKDKYRIESVRLQGYDYSQPGAYFITIVTHNRQCLFGNIVDGEMMLNEFGVLVKNEWLKTGIIRPNIVIDAFVVMPNHLHGILIITGNDDGRGFRGGGDGRDTLQRVSTTKSEMESDTKSDMESDTKSDMESNMESDMESNMESDMESDTGMGTKTMEQFGKPTTNSIPTIVRLFKSTTTKQINQLRQTPMQPLWQRNYYEHIIRNEIELNRIRQYIIDNPKKWKTDENYI
ncbi:MAG: transposase [Paludibacteraceae bacterium]|nr:transposase [Paludibacteraceae bacterium]